MWSWLKSLVSREEPANQVLPVPAFEPLPQPISPPVEPLPALSWRPQHIAAESESIFTNEPDVASARVDAGPVLGIDLGTTHSVVAVMRDGKVQAIPNQEGQILTPSVVAFTEAGEMLVGAPAQQYAIRDPRRAVYSIKRLLGRTAQEAQPWTERLACEIATGPRDAPEIRIDGRAYTPVEIMAGILGKLKDAAERHLGHPARRVVITVPAYFTNAQRHAVLAAAELAGFDVDWVIKDPGTGQRIRQRMRIISEPTAAALALGDARTERKLAVLHMGGGTFDITLLDVANGLLEVIAVGGDTSLGGDDFDQALFDHLLERLPPEARRLDPLARQRLRSATEQAKRDLSQASEITLDLSWLVPGSVLRLTVTRGEFEQLVQPLLERCSRLVKDAFDKANGRVQAREVGEVLIIGGMTRMPRLRQLFEGLFPQAARRAITLDEIVALGAAIQGEQLLLGSRSQLLVLDVAPLALGLESASGEFITMVPGNSTIPTRRARCFTVRADHQAGVSIRVFQEEGRDRRFLGQLDLDGLNGLPTQTKIEVTFDIDVNGILLVTASEPVSGKVRSMRMVPRLPADLLQARKQLQQRIADIEKVLRERGQSFAPADQEPLRRLLERGRAVVRGEEVNAMRRATQELERVCDAMSRYLAGDLDVSALFGITASPSFKKVPEVDMNLEL